jgi:hypothetical protein
MMYKPDFKSVRSILVPDTKFGLLIIALPDKSVRINVNEFSEPNSTTIVHWPGLDRSIAAGFHPLIQFQPVRIHKS